MSEITEKHQIILREEGLFKKRDSRHKGCQLQLT